MRLEKYIATSGIASRRSVKKSIRDGAVTVNGEPVLVPGHPIKVGIDAVEFEGKQIEPLADHLYLMLNKPAGYLTTRRDERGRPTVMDLLTDLPNTLYPVGRLDLETEGLLLFTDDGDFAHRLLHPSHEVEKTYRVWVRGVPSDDAVQQLRQGIMIPSGTTAPAKVKRLRVGARNVIQGMDFVYLKTKSPRPYDGTTAKFEVVIHEGKKRQVRLMFKAVGHPVIRLKRVRIGNLRLGNLPSGRYRFLTSEEISKLMV